MTNISAEVPRLVSMCCHRAGRGASYSWHNHPFYELTLVTESGEELLRAGDCAAFQRGVEDGHHLINKSARPARVLEIGNSDAQDRCVYSDIDMVAGPGSERYRHRDGTPYPPKPG